MGIRAVIFSWKIGKKGILLTLLAHKQCSFDSIDVFLDQIWAWHKGIFHKKIETNYMRALCFWEKRRFFGQNMRMKAVDVLEKHRASYWLFWPIIFCSFVRIDVFLPNMGITAGGFSWKFWKKWHESTVFLRELTIVWQNVGMRTLYFLEDWCFCHNMVMRAVGFSWHIGKKGILLTFLEHIV